LLYAGAFSPLGLEATALVGLLDSTHQVNLGAGAQGPQLVLHHDHGCARHRHGLLARGLVAFARPAAATNPDHVIQFSASDNTLQASKLTTPRPAIQEQPDSALTELILRGAAELWLSFCGFHPPPDEQGQRRCHRSTVLLI
jgi:hypothetical protein